MHANRLLLLIAAPLLLVLVALAIFAYRFGSSERTQQAWVLHTYQVMDNARKILSDMQDAETGERGYLLTHQDSFLAPYRSAMSAIGKDLASFESLTDDNPQQRARARTFRALVKKRMESLAQVRAAPAAPLPSPALVAAMQLGKTDMDALRAEVMSALAEERTLLRSRILARRAAERREVIASLAAATASLLVLLLAAVSLSRSNVRLAKSETERNIHAQLLQATLDNIRDGVAVFDAEGRLVAFNSNFFGCMGFPTELAVQGTHISRFDELAAERRHTRFTELPLVTGGYGAGFREITFDDRHIELYRNGVSVGGFLVACLDVTSRVQTESALRQAQKMETVGQLTGGVAHDFNNLLQVIGANLDLLVSDLRDHARGMARLQSAIAAVERGSRLTAQLLAFARRQALAPRPLNLAKFMQEMTDLLQRTLGERIELEAIATGGLWSTLVDQSQLENAVLNLAINARDAMPNGGKLTIEVANAALDENYAREHAEVSPGQYVMLAVTDTGHGMSADVAARAFEPFYTTKPEGHGTGLGLSQVYGFVKQSGGHIKIYSEPSEGTTIKLYLPRSKAAPQWSAPVLVKPEQGSGETVLVVEDDDAVRTAATDMLTELGYSVLPAETTEQALALLKDGARPHILFSDVVMPGPLSTREFARLAGELVPGLKVLFTSGYTQNAIVHNGRLDDGIDLLSKPYRKDELARKLRAMLDRPASAPHESAPSAATSSNVGDAPPASAQSRGKVLIVEDSALIRMTVVDMVSELGHAFHEVGDAAEALGILRSDPDVAVLLTDLGLPGMSGGDLAVQARKLRPKLRIIVASGYSEESRAEDKLSADAWLRKPFTLEQLRAALGGA